MALNNFDNNIFNWHIIGLGRFWSTAEHIFTTASATISGYIIVFVALELPVSVFIVKASVRSVTTSIFVSAQRPRCKNDMQSIKTFFLLESNRKKKRNKIVVEQKKKNERTEPHVVVEAIKMEITHCILMTHIHTWRNADGLPLLVD